MKFRHILLVIGLCCLSPFTVADITEPANTKSLSYAILDPGEVFPEGMDPRDCDTRRCCVSGGGDWDGERCEVDALGPTQFASSSEAQFCRATGGKWHKYKGCVRGQVLVDRVAMACRPFPECEIQCQEDPTSCPDPEIDKPPAYTLELLGMIQAT